MGINLKPAITVRLVSFHPMSLSECLSELGMNHSDIWIGIRSNPSSKSWRSVLWITVGQSV